MQPAQAEGWWRAWRRQRQRVQVAASNGAGQQAGQGARRQRTPQTHSASKPATEGRGSAAEVHGVGEQVAARAAAAARHRRMPFQHRRWAALLLLLHCFLHISAARAPAAGLKCARGRARHEAVRLQGILVACHPWSLHKHARRVITGCQQPWGGRTPLQLASPASMSAAWHCTPWRSAACSMRCCPGPKERGWACWPSLSLWVSGWVSLRRYCIG